MVYSPFLFVATVVVTFLLMMGETTSGEYIQYTTVPGYFQQDDPATDSGSFDYASPPVTRTILETNTSQTASNFGLIDRTYDTDSDYDPDQKKTQWQRFEHQVFQLNRRSGRQVQYKVLFSQSLHSPFFNGN
jgi:hypothetical protein